MVRPLFAEEIETYRRDGVVKLPLFVSPAIADSMLRAIDAYCEAPGPWYSHDLFVTDRCFGLGVPELRSYLLDPVLGENASRAMGSSRARFYFDHLFAFDPNTPVEGHYWHQDQPYWPVEGEDIVSFWIALTPASAESAALKFVPGTHRAPGFFRPRSFDGRELDSGLPAKVAELAVDARSQFRDESPPPYHEDPHGHGVVEFTYEPGDAVMFHSRVVHSSGGNSSPTDRRVAYSARFTGDDAVMMLRAGVFQDPALLPAADEPFAVGAPMISRRWPTVYEPT